MTCNKRDKYFEMVQLASWITDLEPHFEQVWAFQAWNMAWNISVNFKDFSDRWHWVERGMELLRDDGLRYNPDNTLIYFSLSWIFQSKMGQNMDDANLYYKEQWADEMMPFFGPNGTNFDELIQPQTPEARARAGLLREKYKMDPVFAKQVDEEWGPLDWRLPEASAIYWAALGLEKAKENPAKVNQTDLIKLRRSIYQSMLQAMYHGRLVINPFDKSYDYYPDLDLVPKINDAYDTMYAEESDAGQKQAIQNAHRNFLRDAVYFLYEDNRIAEAAKWFAYLGRHYPNQPILDSDPTSLPSHLTLDQYAVACVQGDVKDIDQNRTMAAVEGMLRRAYYELAIGQDDRATGLPNCSRIKFTTVTRPRLPRFRGKRVSGCRRSLISIAWCSTSCSIRNKACPTRRAPCSARNSACRRKLPPPMRRRQRPFPPTRPKPWRQTPPIPLPNNFRRRPPPRVV